MHGRSGTGSHPDTRADPHVRRIKAAGFMINKRPGQPTQHPHELSRTRAPRLPGWMAVRRYPSRLGWVSRISSTGCGRH
jgi:hypothetical protein